MGYGLIAVDPQPDSPSSYEANEANIQGWEILWAAVRVTTPTGTLERMRTYKTPIEAIQSTAFPKDLDMDSLEPHQNFNIALGDWQLVRKEDAQAIGENLARGLEDGSVRNIATQLLGPKAAQRGIDKVAEFARFASQSGGFVIG